jgi:pyruvate,water dikinase
MLILHGPDLTDPCVVGHKFARQETLRHAGFPVPGFFCVPAAVFDTVAGGVLERFPAPPGGQEELVDWALKVRDAIRESVLPDALTAALTAAFDDLVGAAGHAAVRACVVATTSDDGEDDGEDSAGDPMAGLSDSYLYVTRADLAGRVAWCLASAFNPEAVLYRARKGLDPAAARVAVGVQQMIFGARSFVAFTCDPRDGAERTVIAAAHGIGEGVVQEKADIDHFFVDHAPAADGLLPVHRRLVSKTRMLGWDPDRPADGTVELDVPAVLADAPVLTDDEARALHKLADSVRASFGTPQDIEGTITLDGKVHLLQARPMQVAPPTSRVPWTNHNLTESYPGVTSTLTFSLAREFYERIFTDFYRRMGVSPADLRRNQHHLRHMIGTVGGRVYYRLDAWYAMHGRLPAFELVRGFWEAGLGIPEQHRLGSRPRPGAGRRLFRSLPRLAVVFARHPGSVRDFLSWWDGVAGQFAALDEAAGPAGPPVDDLVTLYRTMWAEVGVRWGITLVNGYIPTVGLKIFNVLRDRWLRDLDQSIVTGMLCGGPENRSVAALRSAIGLAELIRADPRLAEATRRADGSPDEQRRVWEDIESGEYGETIARTALEHLRRYGDRAVHDLKLEAVTPRQRPWQILASARVYAEQGLTVTDSRAQEQSTRTQAERRLREVCPSRPRRALLRGLLAGVRWALKAREDTRFCRSQLFGISRQVLWRLGDVLAQAGRLDRADDIVDLTVEEVLGAFDGTLPGFDLRGLVRHRRAERLSAGELPEFPAYLTTPVGVPLTPGTLQAVADTVPSAPAQGVFTGIASSGGRVRAPAAIVLDPAAPPQWWRGSVLIARETDPGWLFLMLGAKAIVVERGTLLSHTAITGRLLGVPTVVAVEGATRLIEDGALVEVDGDLGTVRVIDKGSD